VTPITPKNEGDKQDLLEQGLIVEKEADQEAKEIEEGRAIEEAVKEAKEIKA